MSSSIKWEKLGAIRTWVLVLLGLASLVTAAFLWLLPVGLAALGVSLLLLAYLTDAPADGQVKR